MKTLETKEIQVKDDQNLIKQAGTLVEQAKSFEIKDNLTCQQARDLAETLKAFLDGPGTYHDEEIDTANRLHKLLCAKRNAIIDGPKQAYKILKDRIAVWLDEQKRKREEEQRRAEAEARRKEEEKQRKIQAEIDEQNRRIQAAKDEEARIQREKDEELKRVQDKEERERLEREEKARREAEEKRLKEEQAKASNKIEVLEEKKESVYVAPRTVAAVAAPQGVSAQYDYEPIVENKALVPDMYKIVDVAMLKKMQKAAKGTLEVPGVKWNKKPIGSLRGAA